MLPVAVLALCLSAVLSAPSLDPQLDQHWELWKDWHGKKYHEVIVIYCFPVDIPTCRLGKEKTLNDGCVL